MLVMWNTVKQLPGAAMKVPMVKIMRL